MPRSRTTRWTPRCGSSWPRRPTRSTAPRRRRHPPPPEQGQACGRGADRRRHPRRVEAQVAAAKAAGVTSLLFDARTGLPWTQPNLEAGQRRFIRRFAELRQAAIDARSRPSDNELAAELEQLQFRDFRRTAVVFLGELGIADHLIAAITGHTLDETKKILETYMPRTTGMAARAIALSQARGAGGRNRSKCNEAKRSAALQYDVRTPPVAGYQREGRCDVTSYICNRCGRTAEE
jgi:hypothetical protein